MEGGAVPTAAPRPAPGDSGLGRLLGVFVSPVRTFTAIAARPTWVLPAAVSAGLALPLAELVLSKTDFHAMAAKQAARSSRPLTEAQIEQMAENMQRFGWIGDVFWVAAPFLVALIVAGVLFAACRAFGWDVRFKQALGVTSHAFFPGVLVVLGLMVALWNRTTVDSETIGDVLPTNLGALFGNPADKVTHGLLASIDVFSFWSMALLVIGLSAAARAPRSRVAILVVTLWALYVLGKTGVTALFAG